MLYDENNVRRHRPMTTSRGSAISDDWLTITHCNENECYATRNYMLDVCLCWRNCVLPWQKQTNSTWLSSASIFVDKSYFLIENVIKIVPNLLFFFSTSQVVFYLKILRKQQLRTSLEFLSVSLTLQIRSTTKKNN